MNRSTKTNDTPLPKITKTYPVFLVGPDTRMKMGDFTLTEEEPGPQYEDFADAAFKECRSSLQRLMVPAYRVVVVDGDSEVPYGLTRWIKLREIGEEKFTKKQPIHKRGRA